MIRQLLAVAITLSLEEHLLEREARGSIRPS
jgi:hypothetical protein